MNKKNLKRASFLLYLIMLIGGLFVYYEIFFLPAFILAAAAFTGIVLIERHLNSLPPDEEEKQGWERIRSHGRNKYIFGSLKMGLLLTAIFLGIDLVKNSLDDKPLFENLGTGLIVALILFVLVPLYINWEMWRFYEQKFNESKTLETTDKA